MGRKSPKNGKNLIHIRCILLSDLSGFVEYFGSLHLYLHSFVFRNHIRHKKYILIDFGKVIYLINDWYTQGRFLPPFWCTFKTNGYIYMKVVIEKNTWGGERVYVGTLFRRMVLAQQKVAYPPWNSILFQGKFFRSEKFDLSMDLARFPEKKEFHGIWVSPI